MLDIITFIVLAVATTATAIGVIAFKNAVHCALSLILTLLFLALFYLQLNAMFIAVVQVLIYAGAIMVLFLFVVTMLAPDQNEAVEDRISWQRIVGGLLGLVLVAGLSYSLFTNAYVAEPAKTADSMTGAMAKYGGSTEAFGMALFHGFLFPFEVTSLLIIVAIVGALVFGRRATS